MRYGIGIMHKLLQKCEGIFSGCTFTIGYISGGKLTARINPLCRQMPPSPMGIGESVFNTMDGVVGMPTLVNIEKTPSEYQRIQEFAYQVPINTAKEFFARFGTKQTLKDSLVLDIAPIKGTFRIPLRDSTGVRKGY